MMGVGWGGGQDYLIPSSMSVIATEFSSLFTESLGEARRVEEDLNIFFFTDVMTEIMGKGYLILYPNISIATGFHSRRS